MANYEIYFSPTGGTKRVSNIITGKLFDNKKIIDLQNRKIDYSKFSFSSDDIVTISIPSFSGRVPKVIVDRIKQLKGNNTKVIIVCVYGNRDYDDTLVELSDILENNNFKIIAGICAIAQHSLAKMYATNRPDDNDKKVLESFVEKIIIKLKNNTNDKIILKGNRPYKPLSKSVFPIEILDNCNQCKLCAEICPTGAIDINDVKKIDLEKCIFCASCIKNCPQNARRFPIEVQKKVKENLKKVCSIRKENELFL